MRRRGAMVVALAVTLATLGAACGSSDGASGGEGGSSSTTAGNGEPVTVGGAGSLKGYEGVAEGAQARIDRANADGGVLGHKIEFVGFTDDGGDPNAADTAIRKLVQQDKVDAVTPIVPFRVTPQTAQFMEENNVPWNAIGAAAIMCENEGGFAFNGCSVPGLSKSTQDAQVQWIPKALGKDNLDGVTVAVQGIDIPGGDEYRAAQAEAVEKLGATVVYNDGAMPFGATNVQTFVDGMIAAKPDIVLIVSDFSTTVALSGGLKANGYTGTLFNSSAYVPGVLAASADTQKALEGSFVATAVPVPEDDSEFSKEMMADLDAAGVKPTFGAIQGYLSLDIYIQLLENAGGDPTKVIDAGNSGDFTYTSSEGGFTTPFPASHSQSAPCSGMVQIKGTEFVSVAPFTCQD